MNYIKAFIPQIVFLFFFCLLCMTYITDSVVKFQIIVFFLIVLLYICSAKHPISRRNARVYRAMIFFSVIYFLRAFFDIFLFDVKQTLFGNDYTVFVFLFVGPFLQFAIVPRQRLDKKNFSWAFWGASILLLLSLYMSFSNIASGNIIMTGDQRIQAGENLGVIQYGHLGLTSVIMGIVMFMKRKDSMLFFIIAPLLLAIGLLSIVMAGTRSAMVGLLVIIIFFIATRLSLKTITLSLLCFVILLVVFLNMLDYLDAIGANGAVRVLNLIRGGGDQSSGRLDIWKQAFSEIIWSPLIGVSCFINNTKYGFDFLHNSFVEVAYALGIVGLMPFVVINIYALISSFRIFKHRNIDYMCFAMLYLQYFTYTMFSESIVRLPEFWYFLSMVICIGFNYLPIKKTKIYDISCNTNV